MDQSGTTGAGEIGGGRHVNKPSILLHESARASVRVVYSQWTTPPRRQNADEGRPKQPHDSILKGMLAHLPLQVDDNINSNNNIMVSTHAEDLRRA